MISRHPGIYWCAFLMCLLGPALAPAAPIGDDPDKKSETPAEKLRKALEQKVDLDIAQQPLTVAVNLLGEQAKINIVLDRFGLGQMGVDPDQDPISLKVRGVKARTALRNLASQYNLGIAIIGDSVIVSSEELAMQRQLRQKVNVDFDKAQLGSALKRLSRETATNLLLDPRVQKEAQTQVTLQIEDVPLETAVRLMAEMAGLKPVRMGNVLFVTGKANAAELRADPEITPPTPPTDNPQPPRFVNPGMIGGAVPAPPPAIAPPPPIAPPAKEKPVEKVLPPIPPPPPAGAPPGVLPPPSR